MGTWEIIRLIFEAVIVGGGGIAWYKARAEKQTIDNSNISATNQEWRNLYDELAKKVSNLETKCVEYDKRQDEHEHVILQGYKCGFIEKPNQCIVLKQYEVKTTKKTE